VAKNQSRFKRSAMWTGGFVCTIGLFVAAV